MADKASSTITINADKASIMAVIADFERYPEWAGYMKKVEVLDVGSTGRADRVHFVLDAGVLKADYTLGYTWGEDDSEVSWKLEKGSLKDMDGSYRLDATDAADNEATTVTYSLAVELGVPMLGMFKRKAEKVIMDTALKELKKRVEG
jgi:ribosome-associated toxin RatA of RatAB toxin-antitoxin module